MKGLTSAFLEKVKKTKQNVSLPLTWFTLHLQQLPNITLHYIKIGKKKNKKATHLLVDLWVSSGCVGDPMLNDSACEGVAALQFAQLFINLHHLTRKKKNINKLLIEAFSHAQKLWEQRVAADCRP